MRAFLFIYPARVYTALGEVAVRDFHKKSFSKILEGFNQAIDLRYRRNGYRVFWLLYKKSRRSEAPDLQGHDERLVMFPEDKIVVASVTEHQQIVGEDETRKPVFTNERHVLRQIGFPDKIEHLVLGGFHRRPVRPDRDGGCVNRIGRAAYRAGYSVVVDEDLTDAGLDRSRPIPIRRTPEEAACSILRRVRDKRLLEDELQFRKHCPWFPQVSLG